MTEPFNVNRSDKDNPLYTFTPPPNYTKQEKAAGESLVEVLNDPNLSDTEKRESCWNILNNVSP
jgi:hypothetical protein